MSNQLTAFVGADIFDGNRLFAGHALLVRARAVQAVLPLRDVPDGARRHDLGGGTLAPGFVDLQVNGGGGIMFNDDPSLASLETIARAHARLGATSILPTLITDTPQQTRAAIEAAALAIARGVPGVIGLHLEGPHLSLARKGAHDPDLIRPMEEQDLEVLLEAAKRLAVLKITVAPENVSLVQMRRLSAAGILLSLGHTDARYASCIAAVENGARCVTHLFNAMSQLGNREPGLVGATLARGELSAGLIADMIHVHPETISVALRAKRGPGRIFLVSDAMATAGSDISHFVLNGRRIMRNGGRLTLEDGTLAGADLDLTSAIRNLVSNTGTDLAQAIAMATTIPAALIGKANKLGGLRKGGQADFVHLSGKLELASVWQAGALLR
jgi:N-acetylglucosamine-6-phosphate deacetylase